VFHGKMWIDMVGVCTHTNPRTRTYKQ